VTVRPSDLAGALGQRAQPINCLQQLGSSFTNHKPSVELDPVLAAERQCPYARSNRLTATLRRRTIRRSHRMSVAARSPEGASFPVGAFVRASSLHVGAAAAAAALRRDLVDKGRLPASAFDEAYAVARVTPGTNLLAMYALLGERFAGWRGALIALTVGALIPALIAVTLGAAYVGYAGHPLAEGVMQGARAGAMAVFAWAIVRLGRPQLQQHRRRGVALAITTLVLTLLVPIPQFVILIVAGGLGATFMRTDS
jgi:chromate transporter